ncbi:maltotransferase domain-containing protein [Litorihabitans aurantiacus]|uniref:Alpha-1,4-glucan:maltose-1-phosphate maltosyltransferase n=1 Tax=Litorihabitans aurantiacus TaxID=1930061 RepID=A0AA37UKN9_9MICO|nr:maltotransferase domain-containing protein [Litorihabitans aurantiacus]GMA30715.1 alpha-1,4-glucan:maltose-1-phosphate maltosyltransferase [Litorihabitans aurantiacus]
MTSTTQANSTTPQPTPSAPIGRIPVVDVGPTIENGRWPTKAVVGEVVPIRATVFREGHDAVAATLVLTRPDGTRASATTMTSVNAGLDLWHGTVVPDAEGDWTFHVEGWSDPWGTWTHDADIKVPAGIDVELMLTEGALLLDRAVATLTAATASTTSDAARTLASAAAALRETTSPPLARLAVARSREVTDALAARPLRDLVTTGTAYPLRVHRTRALTGAWYELFPRSEGAWQDPDTGQWRSGTFATAGERLPQIAEMGFDVVYLTPIHPIGTTNRKGPNNTLTTVPGDPGSPYGIGAPEGGHDAIHPDLGTFDDFDAFVARARELDLEVALDIALQASPDHPWVAEHPEWFTTRADGSIAYAENPPKKYQDIYPLNFDNDPEGIYVAIRDMLLLWIEHGVTAFRVDNPHTKPLDFWERILGEIHTAHPEVVFLSEAFTRPAMMRTLAAVGFHQSYTYFTWRNTKEEVEEYLEEVSGDLGAVMRPSFWPTTHDILTPYMQQGGTAAFAIRAALAALASPTYGIYAGYELVENVPRPGAQEQIDNEKYQYVARDWEAADRLGIARLLGLLNDVRRRHPALQQLRNLTLHETSDENMVAFSKHLPAEHSPTGKADTVLVVLTLDPFTTREGVVTLDLSALGVTRADAGASVTVRDELSGEQWRWGSENYVRLDPRGAVAHILEVHA